MSTSTRLRITLALMALQVALGLFALVRWQTFVVLVLAAGLVLIESVILAVWSRRRSRMS